MLRARIHSLDDGLIGMVRTGTVYDLCSGWWAGMPVAAAHPPFALTTYRTPRGMRNEGLFSFAPGTNEVNYGFISEVVSTTTHAGTHLDALCHITDGNDSWFGGYSAAEHLGDFGALRDDASSLPPLLMRGVLVDVAAAMETTMLPDGFAIGEPELIKALDRQNTRLQAGDAVLLRTGMMSEWPQHARMTREAQPGLSLDGARFLNQFAPRIVGADNTSVEMAPSAVPGEPQPVHRFLLRHNGVLLLEWVYLEDLSAASVTEFLLVLTPLPIRGATGSLVRPLALT